MKRMRKTTVLQCPEHVFCEQHITRNTAHPFCIRQVCSFYYLKLRLVVCCSYSIHLIQVFSSGVCCVNTRIKDLGIA